MNSRADKSDLVQSEFDRSLLDVSVMIGHRLQMFSEQFPGKPLPIKVIQANDNVMMVNHSGADCSGILISNQRVVVRFQYQGQLVSILGILKVLGNGKSSITLGDRVVPLNRRRFVRHEIIKPVKLAVLPLATFQMQKISRLRWIQTDTINCSSGGMLIDHSSYMDNLTCVLTNIELEVVLIPSLVIGLVRYCYQASIGHFNIGIEFLVCDILEKHLPHNIVKNLPPVVFEYTLAKQQELEMQFMTWIQSKDNDNNNSDRSIK